MTAEAPTIPPRDHRGHKGTFGTVVVVGGCAIPATRMVGAPALAALGALRAGAGLVKLACPSAVLDGAMALCPSATGIALANDADGNLIAHEAAQSLDAIVNDLAGRPGAIVIGPGLGHGEGPRAAALRLAQQQEVPIIIDADALNALAEIPELFRDFHARAILTPHPGEFKRLAASLRITHDPINPGTREAAAIALAQRLGCVVVLKGHATVVTDGLNTWTCTRGHACLATAGTGDVLTGIIAALVAQFVPTSIATMHPKAPPDPTRLTLMQAARAAVQAHALAGEAWSNSRAAAAGMLATELADLLPQALESLRQPANVSA